MEYRIVTTKDGFMRMEEKILVGLELLEYWVNRGMADGWCPIGGVCYDGDDYYQAMIWDGKKEIG